MDREFNDTAFINVKNEPSHNSQVESPRAMEESHQQPSVSSGDLQEFNHQIRTAENRSPRRSLNRPNSVENLRLAVVQGNLNAVQSIIDNGIFIDTILKAGWTALMYASSCGHHEIVHYLLEHKADPNFHKDMFTSLMAVCASRKENKDSLLKCVEYLLEYGVKVNVQERHHMTPLLFACREGHTSIVQKLIECGAEVNRRDNRGWTCLAWACSGGYGQIVRLLLDANADPDIKSLTGQTASDVAYAQGHNQIVQILEHYNKQSNNTDKQIDDDRNRESYAKNITHFGDIEMFLVGIGLGDLLPIFYNNDLTFKDLFQLNDMELEKIGIKDPNDRKKLLDEIYAFAPSDKKIVQRKGLNEFRQEKFLSCCDAVTMMANISKHLAYIGGTVVYIRQQIQAHPRILELSQEQFNVKHLIQETEQSIKNAKLLYEELRFLLMHLNLVQDNVKYIPADLISETVKSPKSRKWYFGFKIFFLLGVTTASVTIGNILWKNPHSFYKYLVIPNIVKRIINLP